jgi:RNA polymerase subunit RPABC4/transcription elongation factor Spt4
MALKTCKECGKEISATAGRCPHCGASHDYGGYAIGLIITIILAIIVSQCAHAGELYSCTDRNGNSIVTDSPQDGMTNCTLKDSYDDPPPSKTNINKIRSEYSNRLDEIQRDRERASREARESSEAWDKKWAKERCESARKNEKMYRNEWRNAKSQFWTDYYKRELDEIEETCRKAR